METIGELQDAVDIEITTYLERAQAIHNSTGAVSIGECLNDDDVKALKQAGAILIFAATLMVSWGAPQDQIESMSHAAGSALQMVRSIDQAGTSEEGN